MAQNNSSSWLDNKSHQTKGQFVSVHLDDDIENLPVPDWRNKEYKYRCAMLARKDCNNYTA